MAVRTLRPLTPLGTTSSSATSPALSRGVLGTLPAPFHIKKAPANNSLTQAQAIALVEALHQHPHHSFVQTFLHPAGHGIGWALDKAMRPAYAVSAMADYAVKHPGGHGFGPIHHAVAGFKGHEKKNMSQVLYDAGALHGHGILRGIAGFGLDVATDPTTYMGVGAVGKLGGKLGVASKTVLAGSRADEALVPAARAARMREIVDATHVLKQGGEKFQHRAALGHLQIKVLSKVGRGEAIGPETRGILNTAKEVAGREARTHDARQLALRLGKGKLPTHIPLPKTKLGELGIPVLSPTAKALGTALKPGYANPLEHAGLLTRRHISERLAHEYFGFIKQRFGKLDTLSEKEQLDALHFFEKPKGKFKAVIFDKKTGQHILNPKHIERAVKAGLSHKQIEFVQAMHDVGEHFAALHKAHGLQFEHLGDRGKLYVPHIVQKNGEAITDAQRNFLSQRGWLKKRHLDLSVAELHGLAKKGELPKGIETNPFRLLTIHARSVANQHADQTLVNYWKHALGVPTRLVDEKGLENVRKAIPLKKGAITRYGAYDQAAHDAELSHRAQIHEAKANGRLVAYLAKNREMQRAHIEGPWSQTTKATIAKLSLGQQQAQVKHAAEVAAIRDGTHPLVRQDVRELGKVKEAHTKGLNKLNRELGTLQTQERNFMRGTKNPAYSAQALKTVDKLTTEHGHAIAFPHEVAHAMERLQKVMSEDDATLNAFSNGYRKYLGKWKLGVTSVNPGYGVRNTLSDFWNMWLAGVPVHGMVHYAGKATKMMLAAKQGDPRAVHELMEAYDHGILSGLFAGDVQQVANMMEHGTSARALAKSGHGVKLFSKMMQDFNRNRENWGRLVHYMYQREALGKNVTDAAQEVKKAHFDYEDLTPFEQKRMKLIAPFYTWSRKNIPFQIEKLVSEPGRFSAFPKFASEMNQASGGSKNELVPSYMTSGMYLKLPIGKGGKYIAPMIGVTDLAHAVNPKDLVTSLLSPAIKDPAEILANKNFLTGQPIAPPDSYSRNPINEHLAGLLSLIPHSDVGKTGRNVGGKMVSGEGASPWLTYLAGQVPLTNMLVNRTGKIRTAQQQGNSLKSVTSWLSGVNATSVDQAQQKQFEKLAFGTHMKQVMKDLRAMGLIKPPKQRKVSAHQKRVDAALYTGGG